MASEDRILPPDIGCRARTMDDLSLDEARRLALKAQGFGARDQKPVTRAKARALLAKIAPLQIDSVNVLVRAQYMPLFSRLGAYRRDLLDDMAYKHRELFEYWGHMASYMPLEHYPLLRWKMRQATSGDVWKSIGDLVRKHPRYVEDVYQEVKDRGPIAASELKDPGKKAGPWWGWASGKYAMEWLFYTGRIAAAERRNFERIYDIAERVIPKSVLNAPDVPEHDARRALLMHSARALGVGTANDLMDYFRLNRPKTRRVLLELVDEGKIQPMAVEGWQDPAFVLPKTRVPASVDATALVSPFDSIVWERARTERLFNFYYRIEIYVPQPKRIHGYYVLPLLLGDRLVARADLKADRKSSALLVHGAFAEEHADRGLTAKALGAELELMAKWLGLGSVRVGGRGNLARPLRAATK